MGEPVVTKKKISPWVWGCGIGCAGLLVLAALIAAGSYFFLMKNLPKIREGFTHEFQTQYDQMRKDGKLSPEQQEVFGDLMNLCKEPDVTIWGVGASFVLFGASVNGPEQERPEALNAAKDLRDALKANHAIGFGEIQKLLQKYPKLAQAFQKGMNNFSEMKQK